MSRDNLSEPDSESMERRREDREERSIERAEAKRENPPHPDDYESEEDFEQAYSNFIDQHEARQDERRENEN